MKAYKNDVPFVFDSTLFMQFMIMGLVGAPVNFHWQAWLERAFPGWKMEKRQRQATSADLDEEKGDLLAEGRGGVVEEEVRVRNWWNIFRKWFTDCITMGALLNTTLFLVMMGMLKGKAWSQIGTDLRTVGESAQVSVSFMLTCAANVAHHLGLVQSVAHRQLLLHHLLPRRAPHRVPQLLRPAVEYLLESCSCASMISPLSIH